ncbi:DUF4136 domain-containing protein [Bacteroides sp.]|uniref:DUF4136 domain-containing protein n=1 Tax=Bacteroides sp. TaxID=29523 RepID=UPI0040276541
MNQNREGMKTIRLSIGILLLATTACDKEYDSSDFDSCPVVITDYDPDADFSQRKHYFLADSILLIGRNEKPEYLTGDIAEPILSAYRIGLENCGFTLAPTKNEADAGLQISYVSETHHLTGYVSSPYWWLGYPGYWPPWYWGGWAGWYYPFPVHYSYTTGALLTDMVDLHSEAGTDGQLPVIWHNYITGLSGRFPYDIRLAARGIVLAFEQSPYLQTDKNE